MTHAVTAALDAHTPAATTPSWRETYVVCLAGVLILVGIAVVSVAPSRRSAAGGTALRRTAGILALSVIIAGSGVLVLQRVRIADRRVQRFRTAPSCSPADVPARGCLARAPVVVALVSEGGGIGFERPASPSTPTTMQPSEPCPGARPGIHAVVVAYDGAIQSLRTPAGACENVASVGHAAGDALESNAENLGAAGFLAAALAGVFARFRRRAG